MDIRLKAVNFYEKISEETNCFTANLYVNGKLCGYAKNTGHGGDTTIVPNPHQRELFDETIKYLETQPQINIGSEENPYYVKSNLQNKVDSLFEEWLRDKQNKRIQKHCKKGIIYKSERGYEIVSWKNQTVMSMLAHPQLSKVLYDAVKDLENKGYKILNKNIPNI